MSLCRDIPAVTCDRCQDRVSAVFVIGGKVPLCQRCYEEFTNVVVVKVNEYNAALDMAPKKKRK